MALMVDMELGNNIGIRRVLPHHPRSGWPGLEHVAIKETCQAVERSSASVALNTQREGSNDDRVQ
jgi:hypothetical protein